MVRTLRRRHHAIVPELVADCPRRDTPPLVERCDIMFPELLTLFPAR